MKLVIVESPYAGTGATAEERSNNMELNLRYLRACLRDCLLRGESPFASHGLYTQPGVLDDNDRKERIRGIEAGFEWRAVADLTVVYTDLGISAGMNYGITDASAKCKPIEYRKLGSNWASDAQATERWGREDGLK